MTSDEYLRELAVRLPSKGFTRSCDESARLLVTTFHRRAFSLTKFGFVVLDEKPNEEILLGLVGKFWKPTGNLQKIEAGDFLAFNKSGYAKAVWNFALTESATKEIRLTTETSVLL